MAGAFPWAGDAVATGAAEPLRYLVERPRGPLVGYSRAEDQSWPTDVEYLFGNAWTSGWRGEGLNSSDWIWRAQGRLQGALLQREAQRIVAWDDSRQVTLLDRKGNKLAEWFGDADCIALGSSDQGGRIAWVGRDGRLRWLDGELRPVASRSLKFDPLAVAVDPHGEWAAVSSHQGRVQLIDCFGKPAHEFQVGHPLRHLAWIPNTGNLIGAAEHGHLGLYDFQGKLLWSESIWANMGSLAVDGQGTVILLACFGHGLVRVSGEGVKEGAYQLDWTPAVAAVDFEGTTIAVGSIEGHLALLDFDGVIQRQLELPARPLTLALDPMGRYLIIAYAEGSVQRLELVEASFTGVAAGRSGAANRETPTGSADLGTRSRAKSSAPPILPAGSIAMETAEPAWEARLARSGEQAATAELAPIESLGYVALFSNTRQLVLVGDAGDVRWQSTSLSGTGSFLRSTDSWAAVASDRSIQAIDARTLESRTAGQAFLEISHFEILPAFGEYLLVESSQFIARGTVGEEPRWRIKSEDPLMQLAVREDGSFALLSEDRRLLAWDREGVSLGALGKRRLRLFDLVALPDGWATVGRDPDMLYLHERDASLRLSISLDWQAWSMRQVGGYVVVANAEGQTALWDGSGNEIWRSSDARERVRYFALPSLDSRDGSGNGGLGASGEKRGVRTALPPSDPTDRLGRAYRSQGSLVATTLSGRLLARVPVEESLGAWTVAGCGLWVFQGRSLGYFPF